MSKNRRDGATIDATADVLLREDAAWEVKQLMSALPPEVLTGVEILAVLAILRGAKERLGAQQRPPAPVLELVRPRKTQARAPVVSEGGQPSEYR
jgi:hypothetical protein